MILKLYDDLANESRKNIAVFGRTVKVWSGVSLGRDVIGGTRTGSRVATEYMAVISSNGGKLMSDVRMIGNSSVMTTDVKLIFGPDVTIHDQDQIEFDGVVWSILKKIVTAPGDKKVLTTVWVRR
jgi:hypothetical protein